MNILRFEMNVPKEVALQSTQGTLVQGRYGDRVMSTLADGGVMYVPPIVAEQIEAKGIIAGESFELCKARIALGRRRLIEWHVHRKEDPDANYSETQLESDLRKSVEAAIARKTQLPPVSPNGHETASSHELNGNGSPSTPAENGQPRAATKLEHALKTAISAACNAEKYGAELGYVVRFDSDAIKSMAITVLINMSEGSRRS